MTALKSMIQFQHLTTDTKTGHTSTDSNVVPHEFLQEQEKGERRKRNPEPEIVKSMQRWKMLQLRSEGGEGWHQNYMSFGFRSVAR